MAADPTYPLLSVFALLSAALLLSLLATSVIRQSWSLGVTFLAFWLFWENLFLAVNSIIWSNSTEIKLYVFCDIVSHLYMFTYIVKPACTLIITRRLYKIASLRSFIPASHQTRAVDAVIEWSLGLGLPVLMTSIFYYIVQGNRFQVLERLGCDNAVLVSGVEILLIDTPGLILPSISLLFYCPKIVYVFYRHSRDTNKFLQTNGSISRGGYSRILILGCLDIFLTLPVGVMQLVSDIKFASPLPWYQGWNYTHSDWDPISYSWKDLEEGGPWAIFTLYFSLWSSVILALAIFALFGLTAESRAAYSRMIFAILRFFGWTPLEHKHEDMNELQFRIRSLVASEQTRTQQSAFVAFLERRYAGEDAEQVHQSSTTLGSGERKAIGATIQSGSPTIGTMPIFQAEEEQFSGNSERSNIEDGGVHAEHANNDHEKAKVDAPHFEGLCEDSRGTQFVCLQSFVGAADTT